MQFGQMPGRSEFMLCSYEGQKLLIMTTFCDVICVAKMTNIWDLEFPPKIIIDLRLGNPLKFTEKV